jgi:hypothetical protein
MFNFLHRFAPRYPTIRQALAQTGLAFTTDPARLAVLERHGSYSGGRVNFFRAFDATHAAARVIQIQAFRDLDAHQDLVVGSGHVEHGGMVVVNSQPEPDGAAPTRQQADRAVHGDDERFVFWDAEGAGSSVARRSDLVLSGCTSSRPPP